MASHEGAGAGSGAGAGAGAGDVCGAAASPDIARPPAKFAMHDAAASGDDGALAELLRRYAEGDDEYVDEPAGCDEDDDLADGVDTRDRDGCNPLHLALLGGHDKCVGHLLQAGADTLLTCRGSPVVHLAVAAAASQRTFPVGSGGPEAFLRKVIPQLASSGAPVVAVDGAKRNALHVAAALGVVPAIQVLIDTAAAEGLDTFDLAATDSFGRTALHEAARYKHADVLAVLLKLTVPSTAAVPDCGGNTAAHLAAAVGDEHCVQLLLAALPSAAEQTNAWGATPATLLAAFKSGTAADGSPADKTALLTDDSSLNHLTCRSLARAASDVPPENVRRLEVLLSPDAGVLRSSRFAHLDFVPSVAPAKMSDVLRVHENAYVRKILHLCGGLDESATEIGHLDGDTAVSRGSWVAALKAAGAVIEAVDRVVAGTVQNAFCAVRPPGHHAGPTGIVTSCRDPIGSHGFCLFNNVAIGAAYARSTYHRQGINRICIFDFDVHHGNGTEAIVRNLVPSVHTTEVALPSGTARVHTPNYRPWLDEHDGANVMFVSAHGFGDKEELKPSASSDAPQPPCFYPGSGESCGLDEDEAPPDAGSATSSEPSPEDLYDASVTKPIIMNLGVSRGQGRTYWRKMMVERVLPRVAAFAPDLIFVSAGFDAHEQDDLNHGYVSLVEEDYTWITHQLVKIANQCCKGRLVSVLEGGYAVGGGPVSAFARSVDAHVLSLSSGSKEGWSTATEQERYSEEVAYQQRKVEEARAAAAAAAAGEGGDGGGRGRRSKRRRTAVDYHALELQLQAEERAQAQAAASLAASGSGAGAGAGAGAGVGAGVGAGAGADIAGETKSRDEVADASDVAVAVGETDGAQGNGVEETSLRISKPSSDAEPPSTADAAAPASHGSPRPAKSPATSANGKKQALAKATLAFTKSGRLITDETSQTGAVAFSVYSYYFRNMSGPVGLILLAIAFVAVSPLKAWGDFWLGEFASDPEGISVNYFITLFVIANGLSLLFTVIRAFAWAFMSLRSANKLQYNATSTILRCPMVFFETTPTGRIMNRLSKDQMVVDRFLPFIWQFLLNMGLGVLTAVGVISYSSAWFLIAVPPTFFLYYFIRSLFRNANLQIQRLDSINSSPVFSDYQEMLGGLETIRAYRADDRYFSKFLGEVDRLAASTFALIGAQAWFRLRLFSVSLIVLVVTIFLIIGTSKDIDIGQAGVALNYAVSVVPLMEWFIQFTSDVEAQMNAVERLMEFAELIEEPPAELPSDDNLPAQWPSTGTVEFKDVEMRYRPGLPLVLKKLTFTIKGGEKVGVCGRTGAGKSSLFVTILRLVEPSSGSISIDDIPINSVGVTTLRHRIAIIPQDPVLFSGTVRSNLDPFNQYNDDEVWTALERCHLADTVRAGGVTHAIIQDDGTDTKNPNAGTEAVVGGLDMVVSESGSNFSVGERQLLCMGRALLRNAKVLLLDEATASVDPETDKLLQATIRQEFAHCTVITIAHRINTILDSDKILVMNDGVVGEFESPADLLARPDSEFAALVREHAEQEARMARRSSHDGATPIAVAGSPAR